MPSWTSAKVGCISEWVYEWTDELIFAEQALTHSHSLVRFSAGLFGEISGTSCYSYQMIRPPCCELLGWSWGGAEKQCFCPPELDGPRPREVQSQWEIPGEGEADGGSLAIRNGISMLESSKS